jgi:hypothetical protein
LQQSWVFGEDTKWNYKEFRNDSIWGNMDLDKNTLELGKRVVMRTALYWDVTQRVVVIPYRRFATIYRVPHR